MSSLEENQQFEEQYSHLDTLSLIREMKSVQVEKDSVDELLSALNKRYDYLRLKAIPDRFDNEGITNMKVEGVGRVQLTADLYASIKSGKKEEAYQYLSDTGHGDVIQPSINPSTMKATIKAMIQKGEEVPEELFTVTPFSRASITKA